jgi:hypothetical protein
LYVLASNHHGKTLKKSNTKTEVGVGVVMYDVYLKTLYVDVKCRFPVFRSKYLGYISRVRSTVMYLDNNRLNKTVSQNIQLMHNVKQEETFITKTSGGTQGGN